MCYDRIECRIESTQVWVAFAARNPADEDAMRIVGVGNDPGGVATFIYGDYGNPNGWNAQKMENARIYVQENILDARWRVVDLPPNHWAKEADPGLNRFYWELWTPPGGAEGLYYVEHLWELVRIGYDSFRGLLPEIQQVFD